MDLEQAVEVALEIKNTRPDWTVVAIGHFVPLDQIRPDSPVGVSVREPGAERPRVIWELADMYPTNESNALADDAVQQPTAAPAEEPSVPGMLF